MTLIGLPADFHTSDWAHVGSGLVLCASPVGLRAQRFNEVPRTTRTSIKVFFPKGAEFESFRVEPEIVWRDVHFWEGWEEYQYALRLVERLNDHYLRFMTRLSRLFGPEEAPTRIHKIGASF